MPGRRRSLLSRRQFSVLGAGSGPTWPNEPVGYVPWFDVNWSAFTPTNWTWAFTSDSGDGTVAGSAALATDVTAPLSPSSVLKFSYPNGFTGGGYEPGRVVFEDPSPLAVPKHLYTGFWLKVSNPWQGHDSGVNKLFFVETATAPQTTTTDWFPVEMFGEGTNGAAPFRFRVALFETNITQPQGSWCTQNLNTLGISLGAWHRGELLMGYSTTTSSADGTIDMWLDGTHVMSYSNINFPNAGFGDFNFAPTWGGSDTPYPTGAKTEDDFYYFDHSYASIKRAL